MKVKELCQNTFTNIKKDMKNHALFYSYIAKEFSINFLIAFSFFLFIFLINQVLVMMNMNQIEGLNALSLFRLVILSTPQFIVFTFPFSALMASAMMIGELASKNEILAMRSGGLSVRYIFTPIIALSILIGIVSYWVSDTLNPWAASQYKRAYAKIIDDMPAMTLREKTATNIVGNMTAKVGRVDGKKLSDVTILNLRDKKNAQMIEAKTGSIYPLDASQFLYAISLKDANLLITDESDQSNYSWSKAGEIQYVLNFQSILPNFAEPGPTQVTTKTLVDKINAYKKETKKTLDTKHLENVTRAIKIASNLRVIENLASISEEESTTNNLRAQISEAHEELKKKNVNSMASYIASEYHRRFALATACFLLVLLSIPLAYTKMKYGKLLGFAISSGICVLYWLMLFVGQFKSISHELSSVFGLMWAGNFVILFAAAIILWRVRKA